MKRTLSLVLALVMVLGTFTMAFADMTDAQMEAGALLDELGVLNGDGEGDLYLDSALKRQDAVIMLSRLMGEEEIAINFPVDEDAMYPDVKDPFYNGYLAWAQANGTFVGNDEGNFGFDASITAKAYAKVLLTALGYEQDVDFEYDDALVKAKELGIVVEDTDGVVLRGIIAVMTVNALATDMKDGSETLGEKLGKVVTPPAPTEIKVEDVTATNLKQIMVEFNGKVDEATATKLDNYTFEKGLESAELLEDGMNVVLTLKEADTLKNQKEYKLTVNNVLLADSEVKLAKVEKKFTAIDNTLPTVKDVVGLGTKAIKVVFSEPVTKNTASRITSYKIDDKVFSGSIKYVYPNSVIISTNMSVGEHKLLVKNVEDFAEFKVQETGFDFTIVEDNDAPEIVSAKSVDLYEVEVTFNEPVKSISNGYHTSKSNKATRPYNIASEKVVLNFKNAMTLGNTTIYVDGAEDYSGNKADRTIVITPELDTTRPEVVAVDVKDGKEFKIVFNKNINEDDAKKASNYVVKNAEGKVPSGHGLNSKGNPIVTIGLDKKEVKFTLRDSLPKENYTLEISGIRDMSYIKNTMLPHTETFTVGDTGKPELVKTWVEEEVSGSKTSQYIYVQFNEAVATEGNGNALELVKYNYTKQVSYDNYYAATYTWNPMPTDSTIDLVGEDTVRVNLPTVDTGKKLNITGIRVTLVADLEDNFVEDLVAYKATNNSVGTVALEKVEAVEEDVIKATFKGKLISVYGSDFTLEKVGSPSTTKDITLEDFSYSGAKTVATFRLGSSVTEDVYSSDKQWNLALTKGSDDLDSQDNFGAKVSIPAANAKVVDKINPTYNKIESHDHNTDTVVVKFNEALKINSNVTSVVKVKVNGESVDIQKLEATESDKNMLTITLKANINEASSYDIEVEVLEANDTVKVITDLKGNAAVPFVAYKDIIK
jgi:Big-like domain-containing protein